MTEDLLARLGHIQRQVQQLQSAMAAMQSQPRPSHGRGSDPDGWVSVVVDGEGLPSLIEVRAGWQRQVDPAELGQLVVLACEQAVAEVTRTWAQSLDLDALTPHTQQPSLDEVPHDQPPPPVREAPVLGRPRDPLALTEDVLTALKNTRDAGATPAAAASGSAGGGAVSITLGVGGLRSCTIDPRWATRHGASDLNAALAEALRQARAVQREQAQRRTAETQRLDDLAQNALATLARFQDLTARPKER